MKKNNYGLQSSSQPHDGKGLERIAALMEGLELPEGFVCRRNDRVFDDSGVQVAEFDIVIEGRIGTAPVRCLIECRDRPSQGPADGAWIEQLVGRRSTHGFAAVVAVSSTGFTPAARNVAQRSGIVIRRVDELTRADLEGVVPQTAPLIQRRAMKSGISVVIVAHPGELDQRTSLPLPRADERVIVERRPNGEEVRVSFDDIFGQLTGAEEIWNDVPIGGRPVARQLVAYRHLAIQHRLPIDGSLRDVAEIRFDCTLEQEPSPMLLTLAADYSDAAVSPSADAERRVLEWTGNPNDRINRLTVVLQKGRPEGNSSDGRR